MMVSMNKVPKAVSDYLATIGREGGKARGVRKGFAAQSAEACRAAALKSAEVRRRKAHERASAQSPSSVELTSSGC